jgi:glyceraldehyde 3-phosphate dehydrogenase
LACLFCKEVPVFSGRPRLNNSQAQVLRRQYIMAKVQVFEKRPLVLGINSLGRIGKLTLWHHVGRKYFKEIVVNLGREVGTGFDAVAQAIEKDATYGLLHRFLYGIKAESVIQIVDEKKGKMLINGIPVTVRRGKGCYQFLPF